MMKNNNMKNFGSEGIKNFGPKQNHPGTADGGISRSQPSVPT